MNKYNTKYIYAYFIHGQLYDNYHVGKSPSNFISIDCENCKKSTQLCQFKPGHNSSDHITIRDIHCIKCGLELLDKEERIVDRIKRLY